MASQNLPILDSDTLSSNDPLFDEENPPEIWNFNESKIKAEALAKIEKDAKVKIQEQKRDENKQDRENDILFKAQKAAKEKETNQPVQTDSAPDTLDSIESARTADWTNPESSEGAPENNHYSQLRTRIENLESLPDHLPLKVSSFEDQEREFSENLNPIIEQGNEKRNYPQLLSRIEKMESFSDHHSLKTSFVEESEEDLSKDLNPITEKQADEKIQSANALWTSEKRVNNQMILNEVSALYNAPSPGEDQILKKLEEIDKDLGSVDKALEDLSSKIEEDSSASITIAFEE
ncbi:MAG: hypothetical protein Q4G69_00755 [Planctomycetia bacterium]|nr:hypothetical protein [Planctomycetia bacterium]